MWAARSGQLGVMNALLLRARRECGRMQRSKHLSRSQSSSDRPQWPRSYARKVRAATEAALRLRRLAPSAAGRAIV